MSRQLENGLDALRLREDELHHQATHDSLTGRCDRASFAHTQDTLTHTDLMRRADSAMDIAKRQGKGQRVFPAAEKLQPSGG